jgi:hypothetical protein
MPTAPPRSRQKKYFFFFIFGLGFFFAKGTIIKALFPILVFFYKVLLYFMYFHLLLISLHSSNLNYKSSKQCMYMIGKLIFLLVSVSLVLI